MSALAARRASHSSRGCRPWMNSRLRFGNACASRFWRKRERTYCVMPRAVARSNYGRQSLLTCATSAAPIVIPTKLVVVDGMQQAILVCALALINEGEVALIEDPGFHQARNVFAFVGAKMVPRPIDREGLES